MAIRWRILLLLFLIRSVMAFQFATIGAIAPLIGNEFLSLHCPGGLLPADWVTSGLF